MTVTQLQNNQIKVTKNECVYFFSYETLIGILDENYDIYLTNSWDYSNTTLKYLRIAFPKLASMSKKDIQKALDSGDILHYKDFKGKKEDEN